MSKLALSKGMNFSLGGSSFQEIFTSLEALKVNSDPTFVVVIGGDGLTHHALQFLVGTPHCLCVFPAGTGNDISRTLNTFGYGIEEFLNLLVTEEPRSIDVARVTSWSSMDSGHSRYFLQVLTIGFDSKVNARANRFKTIKGSFKYTIATLFELLRLKADRMKVTFSDSTVERELLMIDIGNGPTYGGGMKILPTADPCDGLLNILTVEPVSRFELLRVFPKVFFGKHLEHPAVTYYKGTSLTIEGDSLVYADGEKIGFLPIDIEVIPKGLNVLIGSGK